MQQDYNDERPRRRRSQEGTRRRSSNARPSAGSRSSSRHSSSSRSNRRRADERSRTSKRRSAGSTGQHRPVSGGTGQHRTLSGGTGQHRTLSGGTGQHRTLSGGTGQHRPVRRSQKNGKAHSSGKLRMASPQKRTSLQRPKRTSSLPFSPAVIGAGVGGVILVGVIIWLLVGVFSRFKVTLNGEEVTLDGGSTIQTVLDKQLVTPSPGDLLDVDGKLLTTGGGEVCTATVDGQKASLDTKLAAGNVVQIDKGADLTEDADVSEEVIKAGKDEGDRSFEAYWFGSIHLLSDGEDGLETTKTGKVSGKTVTEVTKEPIDAGYRIYTASPEDKVIALTFDDGPWPDTTDDILDILEENGAKATFFTIGNQIANEPDAVKRAANMGCQVCTHSWDHAEGSGGGTSIAVMSASEQKEEITKGYEAIKDVLGEEPSHVIRAPGGNFYGDVINNVWDLVDAEIGWDVDTEDWSRPGADAIKKAILSAKSGQVVLMHDGGGDRSQTVEALRAALPELVEEGYKFVTVDELLAYGMPSSKSDIPTTTSDGDIKETTSSSSSTEESSSDSSESSSSSSSSSSQESAAA